MKFGRWILLGWALLTPLCALRLNVLQAGETDPPLDMVIAPKPVSAFLAGLRDPDIAKVAAAIEGLTLNGSPEAARKLWEFYDQADAARRKLALVALGRFKIKGQEEKLFQAALTEVFVALRRTACDALVKVSGRDAATALFIKALADPKKLLPAGRLRAVQNLAHLGGKDAGPTLAALTKDADPDVALAACDGLAVLKDVSLAPALIDVLKAKNAEVAPTAAEALEQLSGQKLHMDIVKWGAWFDEWKEKQAAGPPVKPGTDEYLPDYRDPFVPPALETPLDFVIVFDTTGSMGKHWFEMDTSLKAVFDEMSKKVYGLRLGSIRYRASDPRTTLTYLILPKPLTRNLEKAKEDIMDATFGGGSGGLHLGLQHAVTAFNWRANSRKVVLVLGDTTPEDTGLEKCLSFMHEAWEQDHILFQTLYIRTLHGEEHRQTYKLLATAGGGRFYEFDRAWKRLVDYSVEKPDPKTAETALETLEKWLTPLPPAPTPQVQPAPQPAPPPQPKK